MRTLVHPPDDAPLWIIIWVWYNLFFMEAFKRNQIYLFTYFLFFFFVHLYYLFYYVERKPKSNDTRFPWFYHRSNKKLNELNFKSWILCRQWFLNSKRNSIPPNVYKYVHVMRRIKWNVQLPVIMNINYYRTSTFSGGRMARKNVIGFVRKKKW